MCYVDTKNCNPINVIRDRTRPPRTMDIFDEKVHPLTVKFTPRYC